MIYYVKGNIFNSNAQAIVNTVNCVGVMGKGLALQFKNNYPSNFEAYKQACNNRQVIPGKMFVHQVDDKIIINFPTKRHWKDNSLTEDISSGLDDLLKVIATYNIKSIAIPPLGCGLGGLEWKEVKKLIEQKLYILSATNVYVYEP